MTIRDFVGDRASSLFTSEVKCSCPTGTRGNKQEVVSVDEWHTATVDAMAQSAGNGISSADMTVPKPFEFGGTRGVNEGGGFYGD